MRLSVSVLCLALLFGVCASLACGAQIPLSTVPLEAATAFQRLPESAAVLYREPDGATQGAADPRWKPGNPRHLAIARKAALGPTGTARDIVRYAYLMALNGDRLQALEVLNWANRRFGAHPTVFWSEGWIELNLGHYQEALRAWQRAEALHGGRPYWVPYTKALALVGMGDAEAAMAWWAVAQRSHAPRLDSPAAARRHFSYWRPFERNLLEKLLAITPPVGPVGKP